jgi:hypothetical protein
MKQILLLFITTLSLSAQIKGVVKDSISGKPIAYVNIWVESENSGTTSEENGSFSLDIQEEKNIVFSALGYETKILKSTEIGNVSLVQKTYLMPEIVLQASKGTKQIKISNYKKSKINHYYGAGKQPTIIARKIDFNEEIKKHQFLKEIKFLSTSQIEKSKIMLRFFEVDKEGKPGNDYLEKNIVLEIKKGKNNNIIKLEEYNIKIPENGIFIAFEWMIIEENIYRFEYTKSEEEHKIKHYDGLNYQPHIGTVPSETQTSYTYSKGNWSPKAKFENSEKSNKYSNKFGELAIELTLSN